MFLESKIICTFLFLVLLGSVLGNVGDEALRMAYDCALAELDKSVPVGTELGSSATFRPLVCLPSAHCSPGLLGSETARISRSYALFDREVKVGVLTGYHESSMDDILSLHTEVFQKVGEHYGVPVHVKLVEITEQETPEAAGFDQLNKGNVDMLFMGTVFSTLEFTEHNPLSFTSGCPWYYHMELLITPKTSGIASFTDITTSTRICYSAASLLRIIKTVLPLNPTVRMDPQEDDFIDSCRVVTNDGGVDDNFIVASFKGYSELFDKSSYTFIPVDGVVVARAPFFRTEYISAAHKLLGKLEHYYDTGNFELQARITDCLDRQRTYTFAKELRAVGVHSMSSCECTPKSTSLNVLKGTMYRIQKTLVMRLGHISHNYNEAFALFKSLVDSVAANFWERMSLKGSIEYQEYSSASALEHALATGEVDFATTFGTALTTFSTPQNWEFTYSCHTNVDVVYLVTKGITSLEALRSTFASGTKLRVADTSRDDVEKLANQNIMNRLGFADIEWVRYKYDRDSRDNVLQGIIDGAVDVDITLVVHQTSLQNSSSLAYISTNMTSPASFVFRQDLRQACGDGHVDFELGEECDGSETCSSGCVCTAGTTGTRLVSPIDAGVAVTVQTCRPTCGNGVLDADEECDGGVGCDSGCRCRAGYEPRVGSLSCTGEDNRTKRVLALFTLVVALLTALAITALLLLKRRNRRTESYARETPLHDAGVSMKIRTADTASHTARTSSTTSNERHCQRKRPHPHNIGDGVLSDEPSHEAVAVLTSSLPSTGHEHSRSGGSGSARLSLTEARHSSKESKSPAEGAPQVTVTADTLPSATSVDVSDAATIGGSLLTASSVPRSQSSRESTAFPQNVAKELHTVPVLQCLAAALERQAQVAADAPRVSELRAKCARLQKRTAAELGVSYRTEICFNNTQTPLGIGNVNTTQVRVVNTGAAGLALSFVPPEPKPEYLLWTTPEGVLLPPGGVGVFTVSLVFTVSKRISERLYLVCRVQDTDAEHAASEEVRRYFITTPLTLDVASCPSQLVDPDSVKLSDLRPIHETPHATTYLTEWKGAYVLLKRYALGRVGWECAKAEVGLLSSLSHPNVLSFMGVISTPFVASLLEVTDLGLLKTRIELREPLPLAYRVRVLCDVACGLRYLHQMNVAHLSLATDSVYLTSGGVGTTVVAKLADFTLARVVGGGGGDDDDEGADQRAIPPTHYAYTAPERFEGARGGLAADVYSFAMLTWAVLTLGEPFAGFGSPDEIRTAVCNGVRPPPLVEAASSVSKDTEHTDTRKAHAVVQEGGVCRATSVEPVSHNGTTGTHSTEAASGAEKCKYVAFITKEVSESLLLWWDSSPLRRTDAKSVVALMKRFERSVCERAADEPNEQQPRR